VVSLHEKSMRSWTVVSGIPIDVTGSLVRIIRSGGFRTVDFSSSVRSLLIQNNLDRCSA